MSSALRVIFKGHRQRAPSAGTVSGIVQVHSPARSYFLPGFSLWQDLTRPAVSGMMKTNCFCRRKGLYDDTDTRRN
jgi:hypothetical protein